MTFTGSSGNLVPYSSLSVTGAWKHLVSRRTSVTTTLGYSNYSPGGPGAAASNTYSATIGAASQLTKRLSAQVSGGLRMTNTAGGGTKFGYLADARLTYKKKTGESALFFSESAAPSSLGGIQNTMSLGFNTSHAISRNGHAALAVTYSAYTSPSSETRDVFTVAPSYSHDLTRNSKARVSYTFSTESGDAGPKTTNTLALNYTKTLTRYSRAELSYTYTRQNTDAGLAVSNAIMLRFSKDFEILH